MLAAAYVVHTQPRAILLVGSAATGEVDGYSDVDLILYYDLVPVGRRSRASESSG
jgi:predicted nucleotidyltransferase